MYDFEFVKPASVADAVTALGAEDAQPLSGGQTLIPTMKQRLNAPARLVSLTGIAALRGVTRDGDTLVVGAATPHAQAAKLAADSFPGLAALAGQIGDPAVRNRGTIGGSLANNDPSACYPAAALGTGATIVTDRREIAADTYFQGKFAQPASRFALTGAFVARYADRVRVAITGASEDGVFRWTAAEDALARDFTPDAVASLRCPADGMIEDLHGTPAYRAHLVGVMTRRAVAAAT